MKRATSWSDLLEQLYADSWNPELCRFRSPFAFRGLSCAELDLSTSLYRLACGADVPTLERALLRNFRKYAHVQTPAGVDSVWHWLAMAQHHGLPTRLVDWTYSPLVALHFATGCLADYERDGVIWCVNFFEANTLLPDALKALMEEEQSQTLTIDMLNGFSTLDVFDRLSEEPFVVFVEPPSLDARMLNQFALFSLMPGSATQLEPWLDAHQPLVRRIVVPAELKWEVRDKLDQANINERTLFPGLDGLSRWLARYYLPRDSVYDAGRAVRRDPDAVEVPDVRTDRPHHPVRSRRTEAGRRHNRRRAG